MRILLAGESWSMVTIHQKGFDSFQTTDYDEGHRWLSAAIKAAGHELDYLPSHRAMDEFPYTPEDLAPYDAVLLSDIGSNTLLMPKAVFLNSEPRPNRLESLRTFVEQGGGLVMIGGYLTFNGIDGKANYGNTPIADVLPVHLQAGDDRVEAPQGATPTVVAPEHPIAAGLPETWPVVLGYNRLRPKDGSTVIATAGKDPLLTAGTFGSGRSVAYASDCGPHWAPPSFVEWDGYAPLWQQIVRWVGGGN